MRDRPQARTEQLISERIDDELVVYDQLNHVAHCLSREAVCVWAHCDGRLTETEIADRLTVSVEVVERAVATLEERGLLDDGPVPASGYSRRQAAVRLARIGGAALAGPLVYSIDVGSAAAAASHLAAGCPVTACTGVPSCPGSSGNGDQLHMRVRPLLLQHAQLRRDRPEPAPMCDLIVVQRRQCHLHVERRMLRE